MPVHRRDLEGLRAKYLEMLSMRVEHAAGSEESQAAVRARMAELAAVYPGALREIDALELGEIRRRVARLEEVLHGRVQVEPWMEAMARFHALTRGALCAKRWLGGRKSVDGAVRRHFASAAATLRFPEDARSWAADLARVAAPPRGRLTELVLARLAEELGTTERAARRLVHGESRRERAKH
ncbi:MAG: hypothetical protein ACRELB_08510 [Polyangiaceae bacterium]